MDEPVNFYSENNEHSERENAPVIASEAVPVADHKSHDGGSLVPDWRRRIEVQCQAWMDSLEGESPLELESEPAAEEPPDLYAFYAELCAARHEFRKQSRRTTDGLSRFGGILDEFEAVFSRLLLRLDQDDEAGRQAEDVQAKRDFFLPLVDVYDRFQRLEKRLADPPPSGFFAAGRRQRQAWTGLRDGFAILRDHFTALLRQAGVEVLVTVGRPFDPRSMKVVEVEEITADAPADVVLAELAAGYCYRGQVLRLAEVKVAKKRNNPA